nr:pyruvate dehydrogenase E1 component subunit beta-1, mitochondrial [Tanacetum cinerariifolium]
MQWSLDLDDVSNDEGIALVSTYDDVNDNEDIALVSTYDDVNDDEGIEVKAKVVKVVTTANMIIDFVVDVAQVTTAIADILISAAETIVKTAPTTTAENITHVSKVGFAGSGVGSSYHGLKPVVESLTFNFSVQNYLHSVRGELKEELKEETKVELKEEMRLEIQDMLVQYGIKSRVHLDIIAMQTFIANAGFSSSGNLPCRNALFDVSRCLRDRPPGINDLRICKVAYNLVLAVVSIDHIINFAAKSNYMSAGQINVPIVFRGPKVLVLNIPSVRGEFKDEMKVELKEEMRVEIQDMLVQYGIKSRVDLDMFVI